MSPFYSNKGGSEAEWKRDEEEYRDLNEIIDYVRHYSRKIREGKIISFIKVYHGELMNYYKWIYPYLLKAKKESQAVKIKGYLEDTEVMINRAFSKSTNKFVSPDFNMAFQILEWVEMELGRLRIKLNMGVSMSYKPNKDELNRQRIRRSAGLE